MTILKESEWLKICNKVAESKGLPKGKYVERIYYAAESGNLRIIVSGNRFEAIPNAEPPAVIWKP